MLALETLVDFTLCSEGQILLGLDYITVALGLDMKKMERIFTTCIKQYARRRPVEITRDFFTGPVIKMPDNTLSIKSIRWGILPTYPRYFQPAWDELTYEWDAANKLLKVFPPNTQIKVTYTAVPTITKSEQIREVFDTVLGETVYEDVLQATHRQGTLTVTKGLLTMVEVERDPLSNPGKILLQGSLGTGTIDMETREFEITLLDNASGELIFTYHSKYYYCEEMDIGDYIFYKFFALNILRSIASLRSQVTQENLHEISLTNEDLMGRVQELNIEVNKLLKSTISFGGLANI